MIRYAADQGGFRKLALQSVLERPLADLAFSGRKVEEAAVRRRVNALADEHATEALLRAGRLKKEGHTRPSVEIVALEAHPEAAAVIAVLGAKASW